MVNLKRSEKGYGRNPTSRYVILFIDELHTLVGAGGAEGAIDASNILKPALARGELQCIGATTLDEYRKILEKTRL
ncbi:endopeptidase Clp ATP-binding subunit C [Staphylococcus aureus]|uniref:Endopeptidase Clp ATP-binding subunit C n=1 Tax=Staphylococcus aureus TaxID=1280 RepID=A0A380EF80_STAAU|nr:endopeptidase Clp ATP-binding subunit C [Staphylococcus aureus]